MDKLYYYDTIPEDMKEYLSNYGWHFSKKMCSWAISKMRNQDDKPIQEKSIEAVESILAKHNVKLENDYGYDKVFVMHMGISDYLGSSIPEESYLARYVKDVLDDRDGYDGIAFTRFVADCGGKGVPIIWEDMI